MEMVSQETHWWIEVKRIVGLKLDTRDVRRTTGRARGTREGAIMEVARLPRPTPLLQCHSYVGRLSTTMGNHRYDHAPPSSPRVTASDSGHIHESPIG